MAATSLAELARSRSEFMSHDRRFSLLVAILAASLLSTAIHYTNNYIEVRHYPQSSFLPIGYDGTRLLLAPAWLALTAIGALGFWLYRRGTFPAAWACLAVYSFTGISSLIHFIDGNPHVSPIWYATIFTDALAGAAVLWFVYASAVYRRAGSRPR